MCQAYEHKLKKKKKEKCENKNKSSLIKMLRVNSINNMGKEVARIGLALLNQTGS